MENLTYAKDELNKYWKLVTDENQCEIQLVVDKSISMKYYKDNYSDKFDDAFEINVFQGKGSIVGINERSVLLGVYNFFENLGCKFIKPGPLGEVIIKKSKFKCTVKLNFVPSNRHRGICIEGSVSLENCIDIIEWAPKAGFNSYFIQFRQGHEFFERWYKHQRNEFIKKESFTLAQSSRYMQGLLDEIKKRNLIYHAVGHGWTCECLGIDSTGWRKVEDDEISPDKINLLAKVNGKRGFYEGVPLNTHLCYSNPEAKKLLVNEVVNYLKIHSEIDILHFWLADNFNNFCECDECIKKEPIDYYIEILNMIDKKLTDFNIDTKIVFLIYYELLWTSKTIDIINPDRFIMMFAPITRTYTKSYLKDGVLPDKKSCIVPDFKLNQLKFSHRIEDNLAFLFSWQEKFKGDSFLFDYHLMWDPFKDYPNMRLSKVIYEDIQSLTQLKLNGLVSCQLQRVFFPTSLGMYVMGKTLFNSNLTYKTIEDEFFTASFGEYARFIKEILTEATTLFSYEYIRGEHPVVSLELVPQFSRLETIMIQYDALLNEIYESNDTNDIVTENLRIMTYFTKFSVMLAPLLVKKASGESLDELKELFKPVNEFMLKHEQDLQQVFDGYFFNLIVGDFIKSNW